MSTPHRRFGRCLAALMVFAFTLTTGHVASLSAAGNDAGAGGWQMIVLTGPTQIPVALPAQVSSLDYQAELTAIKNAQKRITETSAG